MTLLSDDVTARHTWSKVDGQLSRDVEVHDGTLVIPDVSLAHQGTYRCNTTSVVGPSYIQFILTVEGQYQVIFQSSQITSIIQGV